MIHSLSLHRSHVDEMIAHAQAQAPLEACGLLAGKDVSVERVLIVANRAQSPARFVMDPIQQLRAFESIETDGMHLLAIFHSHPSGPQSPSPTDVAEAVYEVVQVIIARNHADWRVRAFWIEHGGVQDVPLRIE